MKNNYGTYNPIDNSKISNDEIKFHAKNFFFDIFISLYSLINFESYTEIIPNLYVGNITAANSPSILYKLKISNVISVIHERKINNYSNIEYYSFDVLDNLSNKEINNFYNNLDYFVNIIHDKLQKQEKVFIHCYRGSQRSCSLIAAYLMKYNDMSYRQSIRYIKKKHNLAFLFFPHFRKALIKYENDIQNNNVWINL